MRKKKVVLVIVFLGIFLNLIVLPLAWAEEEGEELNPWTKSTHWPEVLVLAWPQRPEC
jgi:hypothetical protein